MTNDQLIDRYVSHIAGYDKKSTGHNSSRSLYYIGDVLYSYGSHYPMAWFQGGQAILINSDKYSNTTSRHMSKLKLALEDYCINEFYPKTNEWLTAKLA